MRFSLRTTASAATGQPYAKYMLSAGCKYEGIDNNAIATAGTNPYMPNSTRVNTEKFLIPCGGNTP